MKIIGLAIFARFALVPDFAEDEFVEFVKGLGRIELAACPQGVVGLFETAGKVGFVHNLQIEKLLFACAAVLCCTFDVFVWGEFVYTERRDIG